MEHLECGHIDFEEKFKGWREEDHEASKLLSEIVS